VVNNYLPTWCNISEEWNIPVFNASNHKIGHRQKQNRWRGRVAVRGSEIIVVVVVVVVVNIKGGNQKKFPVLKTAR
jgi:hypothetical protein